MYEVTIKQALKSWNDKNPTLRKKTMASLADELGTTVQCVSQLGKRHSKHLNTHFQVIYNDPEIIRIMWEEYLKTDLLLFNRLEKIRLILGCEITDLVCKKH